MSDPLATYLHDHLGGARAAIDLLEAMRDHQKDKALGDFATRLLAEGQADVYPRLGFISEWDTAAGQCIVEEAGGKVIDLNGDRLSHNMKESLKNPYFLAIGNLNLNY